MCAGAFRVTVATTYHSYLGHFGRFYHGSNTVVMVKRYPPAGKISFMSTLVHQSGAYADIEVEDHGELVLPQGKTGEIAAFRRPIGTKERIAS